MRTLARLILALCFTLALTASVGAEEDYALACSTAQHVGDRWHLLWCGAVTVPPGEAEPYVLSLAACPGGVDSTTELYANPVPASRGIPFTAVKTWWHPVAYGVYQADQYVTVTNYGDRPLTVKLKLSVRCKGGG